MEKTVQTFKTKRYCGLVIFNMSDKMRQVTCSIGLEGMHSNSVFIIGGSTISLPMNIVNSIYIFKFFMKQIKLIFTCISN